MVNISYIIKSIQYKTEQSSFCALLLIYTNISYRSSASLHCVCVATKYVFSIAPL